MPSLVEPINPQPENNSLNPLWVLLIANLLIIGGVFAFAQSRLSASSDNIIVLNSHQYQSATSGTPQVAGDSISKDTVAIEKCRATIVHGAPKLDCPTDSSTPQVAGDQIEATTTPPVISDKRPPLIRLWSQFSTWSSSIGR